LVGSFPLNICPVLLHIYADLHALCLRRGIPISGPGLVPHSSGALDLCSPAIWTDTGRLGWRTTSPVAEAKR